MNLSQAAQALSKKGVKIRTRIRKALCASCGKPFNSRSAKAQYCSRTCLTSVWYVRKKDDIHGKLNGIHKLVNDLIGQSPRIDPILKRISKLFIAAKLENDIRLRRDEE